MILCALAPLAVFFVFFVFFVCYRSFEFSVNVAAAICIVTDLVSMLGL